MILNSIFFAIFFLIFFCFYTVLPHRLKNIFLLLGSYAFYSAWDWRFLILLLGTTVLDFVCALKMARPTISVSYAKKNDVLMAEMGLGEFCQNVEQLDVDLLIKQFTKLLGEREQYVKKINAMNATYQASLRRQDALLLSEIR